METPDTWVVDMDRYLLRGEVPDVTGLVASVSGTQNVSALGHGRVQFESSDVTAREVWRTLGPQFTVSRVCSSNA